MNDPGMQSVMYLTKRAAQCRHLARQARSRGIAAELEGLADDYDRDLARLEVCDPDRLDAFVQ